MKRFLLIALSIGMFSLSAASCSPEIPIGGPEAEQSGAPGELENPNDDNNNNNHPPMTHQLKMIIGPTTFVATLSDNAAATAFKAFLPMTVKMSDANANEKLFYLPSRLPTSASRPGSIRIGDLMLWGSDCLVLFYETFSSSYSYTRLGSVDNPSGLASALGSGSVTVTFKLYE